MHCANLNQTHTCPNIRLNGIAYLWCFGRALYPHRSGQSVRQWKGVWVHFEHSADLVPYANIPIFIETLRHNQTQGELNNNNMLISFCREFYYIQMEKYARQAVTEGTKSADDLHVSGDSEIYRVLNLHYNRNNHIEVSSPVSAPADDDFHLRKPKFIIFLIFVYFPFSPSRH